MSDQDELMLPSGTGATFSQVDNLDLDALGAAVDAHVAAGGSAIVAMVAADVGPGDILREARRLAAEVNALRAAALPEGGKWHTARGWMNGDRFQTYTSSAEGFLPTGGPTHRQRTWTGPVEPVDGTEAAGG